MTEAGKIFRKSLLQSPWTIFTVAVRAIGTLSIIKIVSVSFGAAGLALFSHFQNLIALVTQVPEQGTSLGIIRHYSGTEDSRKHMLMSVSFILNLVVFILIGIIFLFFRDFFLQYFNSFLDKPLYFWLLLGAIFFVLLNGLAFAFLYARQSFRLLFGITVANIILLVACVYWGSITGELQVTMLAFAGGWAAYSILNFLFLTAKRELPWIKFKWDPATFKILLRFIGIAVVGVVLGKWIDFFVRDFALDWFGTNLTGYWQAQVRMSESYRSVFLGTLGAIFYSQISRMEQGSLSLRNYSKKMLSLAGGVSALGLLLVWLLRDQVILILYQPELLPAGDFLHYQLVADLFALPSYLLVYLVIAQSRWSLYISLHIFSALSYILSIVLILGLTDIGIAGFPLANMIRFILFFILLFWFVFHKK